MGCTNCSGNPNTWCTQCMPAEDTWVAPVDKLPDVFMGDRDHMYLLPNGDLFILSPDRTKWIKVNGVGGGETVVYKAGDGINIAPDKTIVNTKPNKDQTLTLSGRTLSISDGNSVQLPESAEVSVVAGKRIKVTKEGNAYTVSGIPIGVVKLNEKDKDPLVTLEASGNDDNILRFSTVALTQKITELEKKKQTISKQGNKIVLSNDGGEVELPTAGGSVSYDDTFLRNEIKELKSKSTTPVTFMAKEDIPGTGNDQNIRVTKDDIVNAGTIKVGDTVVDTYQFRDKFNIGMFKVASVDGNNIVLNGINDLNFTTYKQTLTLAGRTLSISGGNSVTLPDDTLDGGDNLICNSAFPENTNGWGNFQPEQQQPNLRVSKHQFYYNNTENLFLLSNGTRNEVVTACGRFKTKRNTNYTMNLCWFASGNITGVSLLFLGKKTGEKADYTKVVTIVELPNTPSASNLVKSSYTFNVGECDEGYIRIYNKGTSNSNTAILFFGEVDVYEGTSPRAYNSSAKCALASLSNKEDNDKQTLTLNDNVLSISNGNSVTLPTQGISTQDFNNLKNEYNKLKGAFTTVLQNLQNSGAWNQTGNTIFEGSFNVGRNIATGNINLFGGTPDGDAFIRTNNGKTENDLAGGIS